MNSFLQSMRNLGSTRLMIIAGSGVLVLAFLIYVLARLSQSPLEMLYGGLDLADSNSIVTALQEKNVPFELRRDGTEIWVPADQKLMLRVQMAERQLPGGGGAMPGYDLFDKGGGLTETAAVQDINRLRALEGELSRTVRSIEGVRAARVHLVLPKRETFSREAPRPSASVMVTMEGGRRFSKQQVQAIRYLISGAVPNLQPSRISVIDSKGSVYPLMEDDAGAMVSSAEEQRQMLEQRLKQEAENLLERSVGPGNASVTISVEMDLSRTAITRETFDPDSRVARSQVTIDETEQTDDRESSSVGTAANLPNAGVSQPGAQSRHQQGRTQESINYEISKLTSNEVRDSPVVRRVTAAILVNGTYAPPPEGQTRLIYQPRSEEEMESLRALAQAAIGYNLDRGDVIEIRSMPFFGSDLPEEPLDDNKIFGLDADFVKSTISSVGLMIVAALFLILVLRPLVGRAMESMATSNATADGRRLLADGGMAPPLLAPGGAPPMPTAGLLTDELDAVDELIDIDKVEGRVKASSIRKISEIVDKHPEEALSIIRAWMYSDG